MNSERRSGISSKMEGIRPPASFLATAATASILCSAWYEDLELYERAIGWSQWDPARQQAFLGLYSYICARKMLAYLR